MRVRAQHSTILIALFVLMLVNPTAAQVIIRPGANQSGVTVVEPTFTPPYRLTVTVYVTAQDGRRLPPPLGANLLVIDGQGRREGMDADGVLRHEIPNARWQPFVVNPAPQTPVGPRGQMGTGITLDDPSDGRYFVEIAGTDRVLVDLAVAQWDRDGHRRWMHFTRASTEPGAVDRWELPYTAAARPAFDLKEERDASYLSVRAYGRRGDAFVPAITELLLTDPRGRRFGRAPKTRQDFQEIPRANYDSGTGDVEGRELEVMRLAAGAYTLEVTGTAAGAYDVAVYLTDRGGQSSVPLEITGVPTRAGETHRYVLRPDAPPTVGGAFGHGARLLSYATPTAAHTDLPAGETAATIVIVYGPTIARESFRATLGGRDVSVRFKPAPSGAEAVRLPLATGSNTLVLSIRGTAPDGQTIVHSDQLELVRR